MKHVNFRFEKSCSYVCTSVVAWNPDTVLEGTAKSLVLVASNVPVQSKYIAAKIQQGSSK